jgi:rhodanese-related sulfurtransferase
VAALRNGTIGWTLAGLVLDHGRTERFGAVSPPALEASRRAAQQLAERAGVRRIDRRILEAWSGDETRTLYRFDVRTPEEYAVGHPAGFRSAPGGQLVQETDVFAPVRGARLVLADDDGVRAHMSASWLAQMGWEACVLEESATAGALERGEFQSRRPPLPDVRHIGSEELARLLERDGATLIDLGSNAEYERGHLPGAWWVLRSQLEKIPLAAEPERTVVLLSADGVVAAYAAADVETLTGARPRVLDGGSRAWAAEGRPLERGPARLLSPAIDAYKRPYEGTDNPREAMQGYLEWEYGLVEQLARDGTHHFHVV